MVAALSGLKLRSKVTVLGDAGVGKSALTQMFQSNGQKFPKNYLMTIGVDFVMKPVAIPDTQASVELYLFDTAGQDLFAEMAPHYWENTSSVILVYDVTRPESLQHCADWLERLGRVVPTDALLAGVLVANKTDLNERAEVSREAGEEFARRHDFAFFECSALEHAGVEAPFAHIAATTHRRYLETMAQLEGE